MDLIRERAKLGDIGAIKFIMYKNLIEAEWWASLPTLESYMEEKKCTENEVENY